MPTHDPHPHRIVCLTEEPTEVLYRIGEADRIVGISGFTVRPARARKEKPKVSAFTSARLEKILELRPDLVIGFSDIQADIARELIGAGVEVWISNHRSVQGIVDYCLRLCCLVGRPEAGQALVDQLQAQIEQARQRAAVLPRRPRVYFEEWDEPRICGIRWVSELITLAGGEDVFAARGQSSLARGRILESDEEVFAAAPELIVGSWCGKRFAPDRVRARPGWADVPAVRNDQLAEIKSALILQPGPAAILDGLPALQRLIEHCAALPAEPRR
ncbi:MAG: ABC transporter substrate-binding protein [Xanthomonadales bacterium]|nr:ABC transporter substrate-binding protein [Xanthomonadales bacterium]